MKMNLKFNQNNLYPFFKYVRNMYMRNRWKSPFEAVGSAKHTLNTSGQVETLDVFSALLSCLT